MLGSASRYAFSFMIVLLLAGLLCGPAGGGRSAAGAELAIAVNLQQVDLSETGAIIDRENRMLVPVRALVRAFSLAQFSTSVDWEAEDRLVTLRFQGPGLSNAAALPGREDADREMIIQLTVGAAQAVVNGETVPLQSPVQLHNGRTLVPLRFLSETLGASVHYDADRRQVNVFYGVNPSRFPGHPFFEAELQHDRSREVIHHLVSNPYSGIDWERIARHKAALHFHTDRSDGELNPTAAIERYRARGFTVLSITDHDNMGNPGPTWPWPYVPEGLLPVMGNELSYQHHITSYFSPYHGSPGGSEHESLSAVETDGGLANFAHPGRYNKPENWTWYVPYYREHDILFGLEVYNMGDRYPSDRKLWDNLLIHFMPERPIYGLSNDDMHREHMLGINWNTLLLEELSSEAVRDALQRGRFFFSYAPAGSAPDIERVVAREGALEVLAEEGRVQWISAGDVIHEGSRLEFKHNRLIHGYARAVVITGEGRTYTQPFGFYRQEK